MLATGTAQQTAGLCDVPQIQAASIWSAPFDLTALGCGQGGSSCQAGQGGGTIEKYLGCYIMGCPQTYINASPAT